ncbi:hypothetical protein SGGMMB4_02292 [Sodalis glossinidius str. 'morsitans']|uniref:Uncharacterized protein n=1 Tax=Sodalis glossinidius (strain morsitans) TaxID=343509 RepID=A0A193QI98_SODGM|nr:hypothetical protein SGGMMB4_02292 [Sodalis glossinidius str. 'morsitans']
MGDYDTRYCHNALLRKKIRPLIPPFRFKTLMGDHLSLRDYDAQVGEAIAMVKALNKMTLLGMPNSIRIA